MSKIAAFAILIILVSILFVIPWTTIPRTNSIIYQAYWLELLLPAASISILDAGYDLLDLTIWTKEKSLISLKVFSKMFLTYGSISIVAYVLSYVIWCLILGYNHPLPYVSLLGLPVWIICVFLLWFILPSNLIEKEGFKKQLRMYTAYVFWVLVTMMTSNLLDYLFINIPSDFQFLMPFMVAASRELDKRVRSNLVYKMMEKQDEAATALIGITISANYSFFIAVRLTGATLATVFCTVSIDLFLHSRITYNLIKEHNNVEDNTGQGSAIRSFKVAKLILAELMEGFTPMIYAICIAMAFYGPNATLFQDIGNTFWGTPIRDIGPLFYTMFILFSFDTVSALVNSIVLWKVIRVNMLQEFSRFISKYWFFMMTKLSFSMAHYFASKDVNGGMDSSGKLEWITPEGRLSLIYNSTLLNEEEMQMLLSPRL